MAGAGAREVLVIGAGPAGLAVAACAAERGVKATVLDRAPAVGASWRGHYRRLHLHTARQHSGLPGLEIPREAGAWPPREAVVAYLEAYAAHHRLEVELGVAVRSVRRREGAWVVETTAGERRAERVVLATGNTRVPVAPTWPGQERYRGRRLHAAEYQDGAEFEGQRVLVVGFGNSGGEIAIDLHEQGARPTLAVRSAVNVIPREVLGVPILALGIALSWLPPGLADTLSAPLMRALVGDLRDVGLRPLPYGPMRQIHEHGRIPLIDIGTLALLRAGHVALRGDVSALEEEGAVFADGTREPFDAIVTATGYAPRLDELCPELALDARGCPARSGAEVAPGLYVCGFHLAATGMLREIGLEARRIAQALAAA